MTQDIDYKPSKKIKKSSSEYSIVTIPRSGSNYLQDRLVQHTGIYVKKSHELQNNKMITIVRDPVDFLTSFLARESIYYKESFNRFLSSPKEYCFADWFTHNDMEIVDDFDIIIKYESLINSPFETVKMVADKMSIEIIEDRYESTLVDQAYKKYVVSSKNIKEYDKIKKIVEQQDLTRTYEIYNKFLVKAI